MWPTYDPHANVSLFKSDKVMLGSSTCSWQDPRQDETGPMHNHACHLTSYSPYRKLNMCVCVCERKTERARSPLNLSPLSRYIVCSRSPLGSFPFNNFCC